jgi:hypothetical protein
VYLNDGSVVTAFVSSSERTVWTERFDVNGYAESGNVFSNDSSPSGSKTGWSLTSATVVDAGSTKTLTLGSALTLSDGSSLTLQSSGSYSWKPNTSTATATPFVVTYNFSDSVTGGTATGTLSLKSLSAVVSVDAITTDNTVDTTEAAGTVNVTGTVSGTYTTGDALTLTVNNKTYTGTVLAGGSFSIAVQGSDLVADSDTQLQVRLEAHDSSGNVGYVGANKTYLTSNLASPLVLDLNGDGVQTTDTANGVRFDLTATGQASQVGWVAGGDGLLAIDRNHDGQINSGAELFGNATTLANGSKAADGWAALAELDSNGDGMVDASDTVFADLRVWVDADHDGKTDAGELKSLQDAGITAVAVAHDGSQTSQNGNLLSGAGSFVHADGSLGAMTDVWFAIAPEAQLDFSQVTTTVDNGAKTLHLADGVAQQVTIHLQDVLSAPAQADGQHTLVVNADVADIVRLGQLLPDGTTSPGQWTAAGTSAVNDKTYDVYHNSADHGVQVLIEQNLLNPVQFTG